jgi:hypothetical protein
MKTRKVSRSVVMSSLTEEMLKIVNHERRRVVPAHEGRLKEVLPSRTKEAGLVISEICLADGLRHG